MGLVIIAIPSNDFGGQEFKDNKKVKFFYKGPQNNWKKLLPPDIQKKMSAYYKEDLRNLGYEV